MTILAKKLHRRHSSGLFIRLLVDKAQGFPIVSKAFIVYFGDKSVFLLKLTRTLFSRNVCSLLERGIFWEVSKHASVPRITYHLQHALRNNFTSVFITFRGYALNLDVETPVSKNGHLILIKIWIMNINLRLKIKMNKKKTFTRHWNTWGWLEQN